MPYIGHHVFVLKQEQCAFPATQFLETGPKKDEPNPNTYSQINKRRPKRLQFGNKGAGQSCDFFSK